MSDHWEILKSRLTLFAAPFPRDAIELADAHRDALAPHLLQALDQVVADPSVAEHEDYVLHQYAMHLLASWRDVRAYPALLALGRLDASTLDAVLGDALTESYGRCLASVCGGDVAPLKALIEDETLDIWVRVAALQARVVRVLEGDDDRQALLQYLEQLGAREVQRLSDPDYRSDGDELIDFVARAVGEVAGSELRALVDGWFDDGLIAECWLSRDRFIAGVNRTFVDACTHAQLCGQGYVRNVEDEIGYWAGFHEKPPAKPVGELPPLPLVPQRQPIMPAPAPVLPRVRESPKVGRNDPCPCGSGKKYKKCCGAN